MIKRGRQIAPTLDGIREDHLRRYEMACGIAREQGCGSVADIGTGTGYGAYMLARSGLTVTAYEIDPSVVAYGERHYRHPGLTRIVADIAGLDMPAIDMMTAFEVIEHTTAAPAFLARAQARLLVGSVPNEAVIPFSQTGHGQHVRHYTAAEIGAELEAAGWRVTRLGCQVGKRGREAEVRWDTDMGRTLVFVAER